MTNSDSGPQRQARDAAANVAARSHEGPRRRAPLRWVAIFVGALLAIPALLVALWLILFADFVGDRPFEAALWREGDARARGAMVNDLIERKLLIGASRDDVLTWLGPPLEGRGEDLVYTIDIGDRSGSDPWLYALHVQFDPATGLVGAVWYSD